MNSISRNYLLIVSNFSIAPVGVVANVTLKEGRGGSLDCGG